MIYSARKVQGASDQHWFPIFALLKWYCDDMNVMKDIDAICWRSYAIWDSQPESRAEKRACYVSVCD